jgi:hypothetical protein
MEPSSTEKSLERMLQEAIRVCVATPSRATAWRFRKDLLPAVVEYSQAGNLILHLDALDPGQRTRAHFLIRHLSGMLLMIETARGIRHQTIVPPTPRASARRVFSRSCAGGTLCVFLDEHMSHRAVGHPGPPGLALVGQVGRKHIELYWQEGPPKATVVGAPDAPARLLRKRNKKFDVADIPIRSGDPITKLLAPPTQYGRRSLPVRGTSFFSLAGTCPEMSDFGESHDRVAVALCAGWSFGTCPPWFYAIQDTLMERDIRTCVHVTLDTSQTMVSAMEAAYGPHRESLEDDGIKRYGAVVDPNAARNDESVLGVSLRRVWQWIATGPTERLLCLKDG